MKLGDMLRAYRTVHRYGSRELAKVIGISHATLTRVETGHACDSRSVFMIVQWMLKPTEDRHDD